MEAVSIATCTSAEPVSFDPRPYLPAISAFCSLVSGTHELLKQDSLARVQLRRPSRRPAQNIKAARVAQGTFACAKNRLGMDLCIRGRSALIPGASAGLGEAVALALAREGVKLALAARRATLLEK